MTLGIGPAAHKLLCIANLFARQSLIHPAAVGAYTIILYMTTLSLADARANLSKLVESAVTTHERFDVTRNGRRAAVILSADDYDSLLETVHILSDPEEMAAIRRGLADLEAGEVSFAEDVRAAMIARGRLTA